MTQVPDDVPDLAAEYALGLLSGEDLQKARSLERTDPGFRREVAFWTGRLSPMLAEVEEVAPPASSWKRIVARIGGRVANDNAPDLQRSLNRWRAISAGMTAIAAVLGLLLVNGWSRPVPVTLQNSQVTPPLVAMLGSPTGGTKVVASWDPIADQLVLAVPGDLRSDPSHAHELWIIPKGGKPRSLGTMPKTKQMHMKLAQALARLLEQGATVAISVEPTGGSPTGAPTGPVVATGALTQA